MLAKEKIEKALVKLYNDSNDKFYSHLFFNVNRQESKSCPTMGVGIFHNSLRLIYNAEFVEKLEINILCTVLKHEALHIICNHLTKFKTEEKRLLNLWNIAMDCAINQMLEKSHIEELNGVTLESFAKMFKYVDKSLVIPKQTHQYYFDLLKQELDKREENGEGYKLREMLEGMQMDDHTNGGDPVELDAFGQAMIEGVLKKAANQAGNLSSDLEELLSPLLTPKIDWRTELRNFITYTTKCDKTSTRGRRNRRFGIKVAGKRHSFISNILVVLDTSGSMSGERTDLALAELSDIATNSPNSKIMVCEADSEIKEVMEYSGGAIKISGRGGTDMQPAFNYAVENDYDAIICISDMEYYRELNDVGLQTLFVCTQNNKASSSFGRIIYVN